MSVGAETSPPTAASTPPRVPQDRPGDRARARRAAGGGAPGQKERPPEGIQPEEMPPEGTPPETETAPPVLTELVIRRPADRGLVGIVPVDPVAVVEAAVLRVRAAQVAWGQEPVPERVQRLARLRREIGRRTDDIVDRIVAETGKPEEEGLAEVLMVLRLLRYYERRAPRVLRSRRVGTGWLPGSARIFREPVGVVAILAPWNYPFILSMEPALTALVAGNGVVLKPSEHTPFTGAIVPELCEGAGLPEDLVVAVHGPAATGQALVDAGPDHLHLVGGPATGRAVLARAAAHLLPVTTELGGKDPALVLRDAPLERAARGIAFGAFFNAGQTCVATERVYVEAPVYEAFLREVVRVAESLRVGTGGNVDIGPLVREVELERVERHVADAVRRGARVLCGGRRADPASNLYLPTVLADVPEGSLVLQEETFGPILPVLPVESAEEAVARANAHPMGLQASIWTRDLTRGRALARQLRAGGVSVNDTLSHWAVPGLPIGGIGESGWSRARGDEGLLAFTRTRSVLVNRGRRRQAPWWFPYGPGSRRLTRALLGWEQHRGVRGLVAVLVRLFSREIR